MAFLSLQIPYLIYHLRIIWNFQHLFYFFIQGFHAKLETLCGKLIAETKIFLNQI